MKKTIKALITKSLSLMLVLALIGATPIANSLEVSTVEPSAVEIPRTEFALQPSALTQNSKILEPDIRLGIGGKPDDRTKISSLPEYVSVAMVRSALETPRYLLAAHQTTGAGFVRIGRNPTGKTEDEPTLARTIFSKAAAFPRFVFRHSNDHFTRLFPALADGQGPRRSAIFTDSKAVEIPSQNGTRHRIPLSLPKLALGGTARKLGALAVAVPMNIGARDQYENMIGAAILFLVCVGGILCMAINSSIRSRSKVSANHGSPNGYREAIRLLIDPSVDNGVLGNILKTPTDHWKNLDDAWKTLKKRNLGYLNGDFLGKSVTITDSSEFPFTFIEWNVIDKGAAGLAAYLDHVYDALYNRARLEVSKDAQISRFISDLQSLAVEALKIQPEFETKTMGSSFSEMALKDSYIQALENTLRKYDPQLRIRPTVIEKLLNFTANPVLLFGMLGTWGILGIAKMLGAFSLSSFFWISLISASGIAALYLWRIYQITQPRVHPYQSMSQWLVD